MRILVSGNTRLLGELAPTWPQHLGFLTAPANNNSINSIVQLELPWGADNGAFSGFDPESFRALLRRVTGRPLCLFVVCPDKVGDAPATLALFRDWAPEVRQTGQPLAFVGQDGAEKLALPWEAFQCYFIGGSTRWKLSQASADLAAEAKRLGKHVHLGRVNSLRRLRAAFDMGCDSVDGSSYSRFYHRALTTRRDMSIERHLRFVAALEAQPRTLFDGCVAPTTPGCVSGPGSCG